jgi:hypothetical protein
MRPHKKIGSPEEPDPAKSGEEAVERGEIDPGDDDYRGPWRREGDEDEDDDI